MKRVWLPLLLALLLLSATALADEAGVLTETELGAWLNGLLLDTVGQTPVNAPIGEESLTEDGYAFLYPMATLYYNKATLDAQSVLGAVAVTDESLDMPRGIRLGAPEEMLLAAYGWQNPTLAGDESFAPLYVLNRLPDDAYWAWAQRAGDRLQSVRCAVHARMGEDRYTDTGVLYTLQDGAVTAIRVYGLSASATLAQVQSNLATVDGARASDAETAAVGVTARSDAAAFGPADLQFARMDFLTLTEKGAAVLFGEATGEAWAQDEGGRWLHTLQFSGAALVFSLDAQKQNPRLESLTLTGEGRQGPRGLTVGVALDDVIKLFQSDGKAATSGSAALLYGDGQTPPFGTLERTGKDATLRYAALAAGADGVSFQIALHLTFADNRLAELMLYRY
ncbi:MAG: hypothetical protein GX418_15950 [Clostridiales bacterium]|nr:hypothetical protein [Clostridiales bacterium]